MSKLVMMGGKKDLTLGKKMLIKLGHQAFPCLPEMQFCRIFLLQNIHPRFTFNLIVPKLSECPYFHFKLYETSRGGNYLHFTWDKLFSFLLLMVSLGTHLKAQKGLINETPHLDEYHVQFQSKTVIIIMHFAQ